MNRIGVASEKPNCRATCLRRSLSLAAFLIGIWVIPQWWCAREARLWYDGDAATQAKLAHGVEHWLTNDLGRANFSTGSSQFDGEWLFGTYMMAGMGFGQTALEHPEWRDRHVQLMSRCIERILSPQVRAFDGESWKNDPIESLDGDSDHAAYLGYFNLLLSFHRWLDPHSKHAELNDRITTALVRRLQKSPILLLQTYPNEVYPVDNCAVVSSIGLYDRATGADHRALLEAWKARCRSNYIEANTGLLVQAVNSKDGVPIDAPRGSGTCLGAYYLSFFDTTLSRELHHAMKKELAETLLNFGVVREYPRISTGHGDIDSGPVVLGYGVSATGFALASCRQQRDRRYFSRLYSMVHLFGAPLDKHGCRHYVTGGPIGDAILFAVLTAQPELRK